jgi:hypothetical protein
MPKESFLNIGVELIKFYRDHPIIAAEDLLMVSLPPVQAVLLWDMWFKPYNLVTASRGAGKSFILSVIACLRGLLYPGDRIGILSSSFRQAKNTFMEVKRRWEGSSILREATAKRPTFGSDRCYLEFRKPENGNSGLIEALPIGNDGSKIRGSRYFCLLIDEFAFLDETIIDMVIRPMAATAANPMERVKRLARIKKLKEMGVENLDFLEEDGVNKIIAVSSAFYTFNHMYRRIKEYEEAIKEGSKKHAVHSISWEHLPEGFLDLDNIQEAERAMPKHMFDMEYKGIWKSESDGVFKASLIESLKSVNCRMTAKGNGGKHYFIGVDPARASDAFAVCVIEVGEVSKLVYAKSITNTRFQELAAFIYNKADDFDTIRILMDAGAGGGGLALKDLLADAATYGDKAILDVDDELYDEIKGRKILNMFNPASKSNAAAVYATLNLLEQRKILLPSAPLAGDPVEDEIYEDVKVLYSQLINVVVTETRAGNVHFDVPGGGHGGAKKDLYSAFVLACKALYDSMYIIEEEDNFHSIGGLLMPRGTLLR